MNGGWFAPSRHIFQPRPLALQACLHLYMYLHILHMCQLEQLQGISLVHEDPAKQGSGDTVSGGTWACLIRCTWPYMGPHLTNLI